MPPNEYNSWVEKQEGKLQMKIKGEKLAATHYYSVPKTKQKAGSQSRNTQVGWIKRKESFYSFVITGNNCVKRAGFKDLSF